MLRPQQSDFIAHRSVTNYQTLSQILDDKRQGNIEWMRRSLLQIGGLTPHKRDSSQGLDAMRTHDKTRTEVGHVKEDQMDWLLICCISNLC